MDRKLSDEEKAEYQKQYEQPQKYPGRIRIAYRKIVIWCLLILFLISPSLVEKGIKSIGFAELVAKNGPTPVTTQQNEAILRVYAARTWGIKGMFAVHSWIAMKRAGSKDFEVSQIIGWRQGPSGNVLFRETNVPIDSWWGNEATLLLERRGEEVESLIDKVDTAIREYPWKNQYTLYPGPNSNTFVAWIGLKVPEMGLDLPSRAIGKDWRPMEESFGPSASGSGFQASFLGLLGTSIGYEEGLEVNVLGLSFELDLFDLALELPLFGRYHLGYLGFYLALWYFLLRMRIRNAPSKYFYLT